MLRQIGHHLGRNLKWRLTILAAIALGLSFATTKFTLIKAYKYVAWERVDVPVVGDVQYCVTEFDRKGRGRAWIEQSRTPCSAEMLADLGRERSSKPHASQWRVRSEHLYILRFTGPEGQTRDVEVGSYFVPDGTPVGSSVTLTRNPKDPGNYDIVFNRDEFKRAGNRIVIFLIAALVLYPPARAQVGRAA